MKSTKEVTKHYTDDVKIMERQLVIRLNRSDRIEMIKHADLIANLIKFPLIEE